MRMPSQDHVHNADWPPFAIIASRPECNNSKYPRSALVGNGTLNLTEAECLAAEDVVGPQKTDLDEPRRKYRSG